MAFESLSTRLTAAFKHIAGKDKLTDKNMEAMLREIRIALLEADVNYTVVKNFLNTIREEMVGIQVSEALNPDEQVYMAPEAVSFTKSLPLLGQTPKVNSSESVTYQL